MSDGRLGERRLLMLVDHDVESRRHVRQLLELHELEMVQATNGMAALELIQRLPQSFGLVIAELDLPGLSGGVVVETLRLFRPDLPALCMSSRAPAVRGGERGCLPKPLQVADLQAALANGHGLGTAGGRPGLPEACLARARARYAVAGDLVEAALELARAAGLEDGG